MVKEKRQLVRPEDTDAVGIAPETAGDGNGHHAGFPSFKLGVFEGPLDLLLYLIRKDEIDISDIPIARITSEYLAMLRLMESCDLEIAGEYIVMAATLLRIKSAMLLPRDPEAEDEEDPREELIQALLEYRTFKEGAAILGVHEEQERGIYARGDFATEPLPMKTEFRMDCSLFDLLSAFHEIVSRVEPESVHRVVVPEMTVEERIAELEELFGARPDVEFAALFADLAARWLVVVTFLAILEMVRLRRLVARQDEPFGRIYLEKVRV